MKKIVVVLLILLAAVCWANSIPLVENANIEFNDNETLIGIMENVNREEVKLLAYDGESEDKFGYSVSISGDYALIGACKDDDNGYHSGSAYIYHYNGTSWVEQQKLTASDGEAYGNFGYSVSISGDLALIGADGDDDNGSWSGSAYIFNYNGTSWVEQQKLTASDGEAYDDFGNSVSISGDFALIGAYWDADNGYRSGSAYIYHYNGTSWVEQQKLTASDGEEYDKFGNSVSIAGDHALIGIYGDDDNGISSGSAYIYHYNGTSWVEQQKLTASDGESRDNFGNSVSISGDHALIGAYYDDDNGDASGSAYIFNYNGTSWVEQQKLTASDGQAGDKFGVSVSTAGDHALIGANYDDDNGISSGSAYVYYYNGTSWVEQQKLTASDGEVNDFFGYSVSIADDHALIGAYGDDDNGDYSGSAYIYNIDEGSSLVADFEVDNPVLILGESLQFNDLSQGNITSWEWDFENDGTIDSYTQNPVWMYEYAGYHSVSLTVANISLELSDTIVKENYIEVVEPLIADFIADVTQGTTPLEVEFTDETNGFVLEWYWDFDNDGAIDSNEQNPVWTYENPGIYTVSLEVIDAYQTDNEIKENYIIVAEELAADFTADITEGEAPLVVQFTDLSLGIVTLREWDFDNDGIIDSYDQNPVWIYNAPGAYSVSLTVSNNSQRSSDTEIKIDYVTVDNSSPYVENSIPDFSFDEDTNDNSINLAVVFADTNSLFGDSLQFSYSGNTNISIDISESGNVTLIPALNWFGTEIITFTATDSYGDSVSDEVVITINPVNDPPLLNITGIFESAEDITSQTYEFSQYCSQVWGELDSLTLSANNSTHIDVMIDGYSVTFQSNTANWNGTEEILIYLDDNVTIDSRDMVQQLIQVTINPVNDPPVLNINGIFEAEEDMLSQAYDFSQYCSQVWGESDSLTLSADSSTHIEVMIDGFSAVFQSTNTNWFGTEDILFYLDDNVRFDTRDIAQQLIPVTINPVNDPPILNITGNFELGEDQVSQVFDFSQYCVQTWGETDNLTLTADSSTHIDVMIDGFSVTFQSNTANWSGTEEILFYLDDNVITDSRDIVQQSVSVAVTPINDPPEVILPDSFSFAEDGFILINIPEYCFDVEEDSLNYIAEVGNNLFHNITVEDELMLTADENWNGNSWLRIFVSDNMSRLVGIDSTQVIVTPVNDAPLIDLPAEVIYFEEDSSVEYDLNPYVWDIDGDELAISIEDEEILLTGINDLVMTLSALPDWFGSSWVNIFVSDNQNRLMASDSILVEVEQLFDDDPYLEFSEDIIIQEDIETIVDFSEYIQNQDNFLCELGIEGAGHIFVNIDGFDISLQGVTNWYGSEDVIFILTDPDNGNIFSQEAATIIVEPVNDPPVLSFPGACAFYEDEPYSINYWDFITDIDNETLSIVVGDGENISSELTDSLLTFVPEENWFGDNYIMISVSDDLVRDTTTTYMHVIVQSVNDAPQAVTDEEITADEGSEISLDGSGSFDVDNDELTFFWDVPEDWEIDDATAEIAEVTLPYIAENTVAVVVLTVQDEAGLESEAQLIVNINDYVDFNPNVIPKITRLAAVYPNPFNPTTTIHYQLAETEQVNIEVYNIKGQKITTLRKQLQEAGNYELCWQADDQPSGVYMLRFTAGKYNQKYKVLLLK